MEDDSLSSLPDLSPKASKLLIARRTLDILEQTTPDARSVGEIAARTSQDLGRTWHHVRNLVKAGILEQAGARKRAGRPEKLYRASAFRFFIPAHARRGTVGRELARAMEASLEEEDQSLGELFFFDGSRWRVEKAYDRDAPDEDRQHEWWAILRISASERRKLATEMRDLFERYSGKQKEGLPRSIMRFAIATVPPEIDG